MRAWLLGALLVAAPAYSDIESAQATLEKCSEEADPETVGLNALEQACPGLHAALTELGFGGQLHAGWADHADVYLVGDILALHARYQVAPMVAVNPQTLPSVLEELATTRTTPTVTWWERFKSWLRKLFQSESKSTSPWLERLFEWLNVSATVVEIAVYCILAAIVVLAIVVIVNELRAAGVFGARKDASRPGGMFDAASMSNTLTLRDVETSPWQERPALLLRLLVQRLVELGRLRMERSQTHRELVRNVQLTAHEDRKRFEALARVAEEIRFGSRVDADVEARATAAIVEARRLLNELQGAGQS